MRPTIRVFLASALLCLSLPALSQAIDTKIYFTGAAPYSDADLTTVLGLHSGQLFNDNEVQAASQRLVDTGLFDSVAMTGTGAGRTRQVRFTIKPTPDSQLLPASFDNLVWFTPDEIDKALRVRVPLYRGLLPDSGNLADSVQAVLTAMLKEKGITATLTHATVEPTTDHPIRCINFSIDQPAVLLTHFQLAGATGLSKQQEIDMYRIMSAAGNRPYTEGLASNIIEDRILAGPRELGFIHAKINDLQRTVQPSTQGYAVSLTGTLSLGDVYHLAAATWTPTPVYSAGDFTRDSALHPGDLATLKALHQTEAFILAAYSKLGYMDAYLAVTPTLDANAHTVAYALKAVPGSQYRIKSVTVTGLSPDARQQFDSAWAMKPGDLYSEPYVQHFLNANTALLKLNDYAGTYQASADPNTHLVDLSITFVSKTRPR